MNIYEAKCFTDYGVEIINNFLWHCKAEGQYDKVYGDNAEDGTCLLEPCVRNVEDCAALYLLTYDRYAIETITEWKNSMSSNICWNGKGFTLSYDEVLEVLNKAMKGKGVL